MKKLLHIFLSLTLVYALASCSADNPVSNDEDHTEDNTDSGADDPDGVKYSAKDGIAYLYDESCIPILHVNVSLSNWNKLLNAFDQDSGTKQSVLCSIVYEKNGEKTEISDCSLRLRGNTSRVRPEGSYGQMHVAGSTDWHHCHFQINFHKNVKDDAHELHGARKIILKWFNSDPSYVREVYCYDLFRRYGVWTGTHSVHCQLHIKVEGDWAETYYGIYEMIEPIDERFVKVRKDEFGSKDGFLWKCVYPAPLTWPINTTVGSDAGGKDFCYELKTNQDQYATAYDQLCDFLQKLNTKTGEDFHSWIQEVCDVPLLLKTFAVDVACGMWDDYWNNQSNYYMFFNSTDASSYKFYFIPFDYDNTLGTSLDLWGMGNSATHNPLEWGQKDRPLIEKLLQYDDFKTLYRQYLLELADEKNGLLYYTASIDRIKNWQSRISGMVVNATGEDYKISDTPASWGNHSELRLLDTGDNNYFRLKASSIEKYCK